MHAAWGIIKLVINLMLKSGTCVHVCVHMCVHVCVHACMWICVYTYSTGSGKSIPRLGVVETWNYSLHLATMETPYQHTTSHDIMPTLT